jgi:hypothetical protein
MSAYHEFKCDACCKTVPATYNGEHWLPPHGWVEIFDIHRAQTTGEHLCEKCKPVRRRKEETT